MAPHLSDAELDKVTFMSKKGKSTNDILNRIEKDRENMGIEPPLLRVIQKAVRGETHKRGLAEARGRKRTWTQSQVFKAEATRKKLYKKADGEQEVHWKDIISKARVPKVSSSTARRSFEKAGLAVVARAPREKPLRTIEVNEERVKLCRPMTQKRPQ